MLKILPSPSAMNQYYDCHSHMMAPPSKDSLVINNMYTGFEDAGKGSPCSLGIHPWHIDNHVHDLYTLTKYLNLPNVWAVGECGLDKVRGAEWAVQLIVFRKQIGLANSYGKPLMVHCVRAFEELLMEMTLHPAVIPVVIHGFNNKKEVARRLLAQGFYLSFGSALCKPGSQAATVLRNMPADRILLETDDAVIPIKDIYSMAADIRKTDANDLILQVRANFKKVFKHD